MLSRKVINFIRQIKKKKDPKNYPVAENFPLYEIARMISKKTGYRLNDILDVIDEFTYALAAVITMRKNVDMNGIKIKQQWVPEKVPSFYYYKDYNIWSYGNFIPIIEFEQVVYDLYRGNMSENSDKFKQYFQYIDGKPKNGEEASNIVDKKIIDIMSLGKNVLIDENGFIIKKSNSKRNKLFFEWFNPTFQQRRRYYFLVAPIWEEVKKMEKSGETKENIHKYFHNQYENIILKDDLLGELYTKYFYACKEKGVDIID